MKVIACNGSPRPDGNTSILLDLVCGELEAAGIDTERIQVGGQDLRPCRACYWCAKNKNQQCSYDGDPVNDWVQRIAQADGLLLGSPTYFADITPEMKILIDRVGFVGRVNGDLFRRKVGAAVIAVRRGGEIHAFDSINHFFLISQMIVPGSRYWNMGFGLDKGEVRDDSEGVDIMKTLGQNMAWLLQKVNA